MSWRQCSFSWAARGADKKLRPAKKHLSWSTHTYIPVNNYEKTVYFALTYSTAKNEAEAEYKAAAVAEPELSRRSL